MRSALSLDGKDARFLPRPIQGTCDAADYGKCWNEFGPMLLRHFLNMLIVMCYPNSE